MNSLGFQRCRDRQERVTLNLADADGFSTRRMDIHFEELISNFVQIKMVTADACVYMF